MDVVAVEDVSSSIERFGDRYLNSVYTAAELDWSAAALPSRRARALAACFAGKEAVIKALARRQLVPARSGELHGGW